MCQGCLRLLGYSHVACLALTECKASRACGVVVCRCHNSRRVACGLSALHTRLLVWRAFTRAWTRSVLCGCGLAAAASSSTPSGQWHAAEVVAATFLYSAHLCPCMLSGFGLRAGGHFRGAHLIGGPRISPGSAGSGTRQSSSQVFFWCLLAPMVWCGVRTLSPFLSLQSLFPQRPLFLSPGPEGWCVLERVTFWLQTPLSVCSKTGWGACSRSTCSITSSNKRKAANYVM